MTTVTKNMHQKIENSTISTLVKMKGQLEVAQSLTQDEITAGTAKYMLKRVNNQLIERDDISFSSKNELIKMATTLVTKMNQASHMPSVKKAMEQRLMQVRAELDKRNKMRDEKRAEKEINDREVVWDNRLGYIH